MRAICNLLVGLPIFGVIIGSLLLIVQDLFFEGGGGWVDCDRFVAVLPLGLDANGTAVEAARWLCGLPLGGHVVLGSLLLGIVTIPLGLILYKAKGLDKV